MGFDPITMSLMAIGASSAILEGRAAHQREKLLQRQLESDMATTKIKATDEEIQRLQQLNMSQAMTRTEVGARGRGALSPGSSTAALLKYNRQQADQDIAAITINEQSRLARLKTRINTSKNRSRNARVQSLFKAAGVVTTGMGQLSATKKPDIVTTQSSSGPGIFSESA